MPKQNVFTVCSFDARRVVIGFIGQAVPDQIDPEQCRQEMLDAVREYDCHELAFDLTGIGYIPSGILGALASLKVKFNIQVHLYNPSDDVRGVLEVTKLDRLFKIHDLVQ